MAEKYVITISRQFASMGRSIAKKLAEELGIEFYDRDIVEQTARRMGLPVSTISDTEESANNIYYKRIYPLGMAIKSMQDEVFMVQQNIIRDLADRESCIIVGRCADEVLKDHPRLLNVHVFAPKADRLRNCVEKLGMDEATAKKTLPRVDKSRAGYHKVYGGGDEYVNCHLMLNSSQFGIEGSAHLLALIARDRFGL
ncbi:MAG TPA: cytidylate kinase-like family protein [Candidatus Gemmiger stercorigallinarum]|nr:cytidylate kinase-like family protein [Candidatus Gemmiger stercorigallinarum]